MKGGGSRAAGQRRRVEAAAKATAGMVKSETGLPPPVPLCHHLPNEVGFDPGHPRGLPASVGKLLLECLE